jgi:hypothetical protein
MLRKIAPPVAALLLVIGCAGPAKLTQQSHEKLAAGDAWRAWQLATHALDKQPGNPAARDAATAAGAAIAEDWERRIHALADVDSMQAADQVLEFADFRVHAARYATIPVGASWPNDEHRLRASAARVCYERGVTAIESKRPKRAFDEFSHAESYLSGYRDAARRAERAMDLAVTRVAVLPLRAAPEFASMGAQVASDWSDDLTQHFVPNARFTRIMGGDAIANLMTVSQLGNLSRDDAVRLGRKAGAQRIVYGSIGGIKTSNHIDLFQETIARRIVDHGQDGHDTERWVDVPFEVVARVRDVTVGVDYEVVSTRDGASIAHQRFDRSTSARVVWTSYQPEGDLSAYSLVSTTVRSADPDRAKRVETRWKAVCGDATTLQQVLEARRSSHGEGHYDRSTALPRIISGAAFMFLSDLPPTNDLAYAALARGCGPLHDDLKRLDDVDDVDLGPPVTKSVNQ